MTQPRLASIFSISVAILATSAAAQISGNANYGGTGGQARARQIEDSHRVLTKEDLPPDNSMFVDAHILLNIKADEYVAIFAIAREGATTEEASQKMDATLKQFTTALKALHIRDTDIFVDFITEPKIYGYQVSDNVAREKLTGFELKKNVSIHYTDRDLLDKLMAAAAAAEIYDLVKVDYVIKDTNAVQAKLMTAAAAVIQQKLTRDEKLLGVKVKSSPAIYAERPAIYYPTELYDSYTAAESESVSRPRDIDRFSIQQARKSRSFYFNPLDGSGFDEVINPVVIEPVVQFTLYLKLKFEVVH